MIKMRLKFFLIIFSLILYLCLVENSFSVDDIVLNQSIDNISVESYFCRDIDCEELYLELFNNVNKGVYCAFFDFDLIDMMDSLESLYNNGKDIVILVDGDNNIFKKRDYEYLFFDKRSAYMHNKFCIIDNEILVTGSFNPTINGRDKNDNNILIIKNKNIINIYQNYFKTLINESIDDNYKHIKDGRNYQVGDDIEICFSRGGNCLDVIKKYLLQANQSIKFMTFSFTDDDIQSLLLYKYYLDNVSIEGIFERSSISKYSAYNSLFFQLSNESIIKDCTKGKMHHKVFIIDKKIVVTGSFNPSNNADKNNDENLIIINDKKLAENYIKEYERLRLQCKT